MSKIDTDCSTCRHESYCKLRVDPELAAKCVLHTEAEYKYALPGDDLKIFGHSWKTIQEKQQCKK